MHSRSQDSGVVGAQLPHRAASPRLPRLPRRDITCSRHRGRSTTQCGPLPQDFNSQDLANSLVSEHLAVVTPCSGPCSPQQPRFAPDVEPSKHRGWRMTQCEPLPQDLNSQDLANLSVAEHLEIITPGSETGSTLQPRLEPDVHISRHRGQNILQTQCGPLSQVFKSQDLAVSSVSKSLGLRARSKSLPPSVPNSQWAFDFTNVSQDQSQFGSLLPVFNSQDLVGTSLSKPLEVGNPCSGPCATQPPRLAPDVHNSRHRGQSKTQCGPLPQDFNSQDLANSFDSEYLEVATPCSGPCSPQQSRYAPDVEQSKHCGQKVLQTLCGPLSQVCNSQDLAVSSVLKPLEVAAPCSLPCATLRPRLEPDDGNSRHRGQIVTQSGPSPQDFNSQDLARSFVSEHLDFVTPCSGPCSSQQPRPDVDHSRHRGQDQSQCGPLPKDFNAQHLANSFVSEHFGVVTPSRGPGTALEPRLEPEVHHSRQCGQDILPKQCGPLPQDFNSQDLANLFVSEPLVDVTPCSGPCATLEPRLAPDVDNSRHLGQIETQCGPLPQDFNSQDLAISEPLEVAIPSSRPCTAPRLAPDDDNPRHRGQDKSQCGPMPQDFNSQDLANTPVSEPLAVVSPGSEPCTTHEPRLAPDVDNSRHRGNDKTQCGPLPQDFNSQDLADISVSEPLEVVTHSSGPCTIHDPRLAPDVDNSRHRGQGTSSSSEGIALLFGPSAHELQKSFNSQDLANTAFGHAIAPILSAYSKKKKPTDNQIRASARAIIRQAKAHGITQSACCAHWHCGALRTTSGMWLSVSAMWMVLIMIALDSIF